MSEFNLVHVVVMISSFFLGCLSTFVAMENKFQSKERCTREINQCAQIRRNLEDQIHATMNTILERIDVLEERVYNIENILKILVLKAEQIDNGKKEELLKNI